MRTIKIKDMDSPLYGTDLAAHHAVMVHALVLICLAGVATCDETTALWRYREVAVGMQQCLLGPQFEPPPDAILGRRTMRVVCSLH